MEKNLIKRLTYNRKNPRNPQKIFRSPRGFHLHPRCPAETSRSFFLTFCPQMSPRPDKNKKTPNHDARFQHHVRAEIWLTRPFTKNKSHTNTKCVICFLSKVGSNDAPRVHHCPQTLSPDPHVLPLGKECQGITTLVERKATLTLHFPTFSRPQLFPKLFPSPKDFSPIFPYPKDVPKFSLPQKTLAPLFPNTFGFSDSRTRGRRVRELNPK